MKIWSDNGVFLLREWEETDVPTLVENISNIKVWDNVRDGLPFPYTREDGEAYIRATRAKECVQDLAIVVDGRAVGGVGVVPLSDVERCSAEVGYWLGETYWNRGIMTEAVRLLVDYVFENTAILRLFASVYEYNVGSMRVLEKAGFTRQAVLRKAAIKNEKVIDMHYFDLVKD